MHCNVSVACRALRRRLLALVSFRRFCRRRRCRMAPTSPSSSCRRSCPRLLCQPAPPLQQPPLEPPWAPWNPPRSVPYTAASPTNRPTAVARLGRALRPMCTAAIGHGSKCGCPQLGPRLSTEHSALQARERLESEAQRRSQMEAMNRRLELEKRYTCHANDTAARNHRTRCMYQSACNAQQANVPSLCLFSGSTGTLLAARCAVQLRRAAVSCRIVSCMLRVVCCMLLAACSKIRRELSRPN